MTVYSIEWMTGDPDNPVFHAHVEMSDDEAREVSARLDAIDDRMKGELNPYVGPVYVDSYNQFVEDWLNDLED